MWVRSTFIMYVYTCSDWSSLSVYEPELVHDIIDDEGTWEDEDDSNGTIIYTIL